MRRRVLRLALVLGLAGSPAFAQRSGGRFGGSRSYGGSSSSTYRSSSYGSSSSTYRSSSTSSVYHSTYVAPPPPPPPRIPATRYVRPAAVLGSFDRVAVERPRVADGEVLGGATYGAITGYRRDSVWTGLGVGACVFGAFGALTFFASAKGWGTLPEVRAAVPGGAAGGAALVRRLSVAVDWSQRAAIQASLDALASRFDMGTPEGLHAAAQGAIALLQRALPAARYAAVESFAETYATAQMRVDRLAAQLRERYTVETVNNARRVAPTGTVARVEEGAGLVVVSVVVGLEVLVPAAMPPVIRDRHALEVALAGLVPRAPRELVSLEVVWSPAEDADRMSSAELEVLYPELHRLDAAGALGRHACGHCGAAYALELGACPACGARKGA